MRLTGRKAVLGVLAGALLALPAAPAVAAGTNSCRTEFETVTLRTFNVVLKTPKKVYSIDDTVPVQITVTRPAHEDPAGQRQPIDPPVSQPAQGVYVGLGLQVGRTYLFGIGTTDDQGKATINVPLPDYVPAGKVFARALAWNVIADTTCLKVEENGYTERTNFFTVKK